MNKGKKNLVHITALKGIACFFVMLGHYFGMIKYSSSFNISVGTMEILKSNWIFLLNESLWLQLFFVASGYLLACTNIKTFKEMVVKSFRRFLRLAIPVFFTCTIVYIIYVLFGFENKETAKLFVNDWFQGSLSGEYTVVSVLKSPIDVLILGNADMNTPYWVLKDMFFASIYIYLFIYLRNIFMNRSIATKAIDFLAFVVSFLLSEIICVCMIGVITRLYEEKLLFLTNAKSKSINIGLSLVFILLIIMCITNLKIVSAILGSVLLLILMKDNKIICNTAFVFLGKYSFGIYAFHWPLICSVGAYLIIKLCTLTTLFLSVLVSSMVCILITILMAYFYGITLEKISPKLVEKITGVVQRIIS